METKYPHNLQFTVEPLETANDMDFIPNSTISIVYVELNPVLQTPAKVISSESFLLPIEAPSSALKNEVNKFCDEITESDAYMDDEIETTIEETKLLIQETTLDTSAVENENNHSRSLQIPSTNESEPKTDPVFECAHCGKKTKSKLGLMKHLTGHTEFVPYSCKTCNQGFLSKSEFTKHKRRPHKVGPYVCKLCDKEFAKPDYLRIHKLHTHKAENLKLKCPDCDFRAVSAYYLKRHSIKHSRDKIYKCDKCPYETNFQNLFKRHQTSHSDLKAYKCPDCERTYKTDTALNRHSRSHRIPFVKRTYPCSYCSHRAASSANLTNHITMLHNRSTPVHCKSCRERFIDKHAFVQHRNVIIDQSCDKKLCTFVGTTECMLKTHINTHTLGNFSCMVCNEKFRLLQELKTHLHSHAELIKCVDCGGCYNKKAALRIKVAEQENTDEMSGISKQIKTENDEFPIKEETNTDEEPYVILEILKMETQSGEHCVQYKLLRANDGEADQTSKASKNDSESSKNPSQEISVKCCNNIHKRQDIYRRFVKFFESKANDSS